MRYQAVIFDFDGTVADTNDLVLESWQHTYEARRGRREDPAHILQSFGEPLYTTMAKEFPEWPVEETVAIYREFQVGIFEKMIRPFPGMLELMRDLKARGIGASIVTSRLRGTTLQGLEVFGAMDLAEHIVTYEDTKAHKPAPDPVLLGIGRLGSTPETTLVVGDSAYDILCAHNAGARAVLVTWSEAAAAGGFDEPGAAPDFTAGSAEELASLILD